MPGRPIPRQRRRRALIRPTAYRPSRQDAPSGAVRLHPLSNPSASAPGYTRRRSAVHHARSRAFPAAGGLVGQRFTARSPERGEHTTAQGNALGNRPNHHHPEALSGRRVIPSSALSPMGPPLQGFLDLSPSLPRAALRSALGCHTPGLTGRRTLIPRAPPRGSPHPFTGVPSRRRADRPALQRWLSGRAPEPSPFQRASR